MLDRLKGPAWTIIATHGPEREGQDIAIVFVSPPTEPWCRSSQPTRNCVELAATGIAIRPASCDNCKWIAAAGAYVGHVQ